MFHLHLSRRLVIAAGAVLAVSAGATPALAAVSSHAMPPRTLKSEIKQAESTPLGAAIVRQDNLTRLNSNLDRADITKFAANLKAREKAEAAVQAVAPKSSGHQVEIKREWLKGMQYLTTSDRLLLQYLHGYANGHAADQLRITGLKDSTRGNDLTGWAFNALWGNPGPLPRN
jgi:hypothetical protein